MKKLSYEETVRFHGHDGPFLALGYKAGEYAVQKLAPEEMLDLQCCVETTDSKPYLCVIDGIQCSTPCTFGKGNVRLLLPNEKKMSLTFKNRKTGREMVFILKPQVLERALKTKDLHKEAAWVRSEPVASLFEVECKQHETTG